MGRLALRRRTSGLWAAAGIIAKTKRSGTRIILRSEFILPELCIGRGFPLVVAKGLLMIRRAVSARSGRATAYSETGPYRHQRYRYHQIMLHFPLAGLSRRPAERQVNKAAACPICW